MLTFLYIAISSSLPLPSSHPVPAPQIRSHDFWRYINFYVCIYELINELQKLLSNEDRGETDRVSMNATECCRPTLLTLTLAYNLDFQYQASSGTLHTCKNQCGHLVQKIERKRTDRRTDGRTRPIALYLCTLMRPVMNVYVFAIRIKWV